MSLLKRASQNVQTKPGPHEHPPEFPFRTALLRANFRHRDYVDEERPTACTTLMSIAGRRPPGRAVLATSMETRAVSVVVYSGIRYMRAARTMIPIPQRIAAGIDRIAGQKRRAQFIIEVLETELQRREQLAALEEAAGCWKDENHPELANGSEAFVHDLRNRAADRLERIQRRTSRRTSR